MGRLGLQAKGAARKHRKARAIERGDPRINLVNRVFDADARNRLWVGDIACIPTSEGRPYPAAAIDAWHRKAVGRATGGRITEKPAMGALNRAVGRENPPSDRSLVFHGDQGVQCTSGALQRCPESHGIAQSMPRPGNPRDNAVAESFFKTLKRGLVKEKSCATRDDAKQEAFKYIELYCNTRRMHSSSGYRAPSDSERVIA